jgi:hypothetical protein
MDRIAEMYGVTLRDATAEGIASADLMQQIGCFTLDHLA